MGGFKVAQPRVAQNIGCICETSGSANLYLVVVNGAGTPTFATGDLVITASEVDLAILAQMLNVTWLASGTVDVAVFNSGLAGTPDAGAVNTTNAADAVLGAYLVTTSGSFSWDFDLADGGQDVNDVGDGVTLTEGRLVTSATGTYDGSLTATEDWIGLITAYQ